MVAAEGRRDPSAVRRQNLPGIDQPNLPPKARPRLPIWRSILGRFSVPEFILKLFLNSF